MKMLGYVQTCHLMLDALLVLNNMSLRLQEQDCSCEVDEMMQNTTAALDKFKTSPRPNLRNVHPTIEQLHSTALGKASENDSSYV